MIKVNELRDGNYVIDPKDGEMKRTNIYQLGKHQHSDILTDYLPISLTPEILVMCGFELFPWGWVSNVANKRSLRITAFHFLFEREGQTSLKVESLHQLQNLYFCLTGEELEVSLK